ncbi:predicted protein [Naegleria gruberi]|uniref:Predicted protein n=1 Tax=Naegleria gruberi TaxID=5762 RepID=D2V5R5_NAEGR|nr:uncharacterized protein NAEGRDRAFT_46889 [Naegleria gruberi]EFC47695.1 predicted protein [Naegleria gruberi]|eukprot:XP_002680439.1 predicted protein [Naegleria gruberi strain NEG-M]
MSENNLLIVHALRKTNSSSDNATVEYTQEEILEQVIGIDNFVKENNIKLKLQTKYYSADINIHFWNVEKESVCPFDWKSSSVQVIVGIPDYQSDMVLEAILKYSNEIESGFIYHLEQPNEKLAKESQSWCVDNNFEMVVKNFTEEKTDNGIIEEKQGIKRLMEAIECTMWPAMNRIDPKAVKAQQESSKKEEKPIEQIKDAKELLGSEAEIVEEDEKEIESFERLMHEILNIRKDSKTIGDDERKKRAELATLKLLSMMGDEDEYLSDEDY